MDRDFLGKCGETMLEAFLIALKGFTPALIAAAASIIAVVYTQYRSKRLAYFQAFFTRKLDTYSEFWASVGYYEREITTANYARLEAALHSVCLLAPLRIYQATLEAANELQDTAQLSGQTIQELLDMMRLDLDPCRRLHFSEIKPVDSEIRIKDPKRRTRVQKRSRD